MARVHHKLEAWKRSMNLARKVYIIADAFPKEETWHLTSQTRKSAVSIPSNIAEGMSRAGYKDRMRFLNIARGSLSELETQLLLARDFGYINGEEPLLTDVDNLFGILNGLIKAIARQATQ